MKLNQDVMFWILLFWIFFALVDGWIYLASAHDEGDFVKNDNDYLYF